MPSTSLGRLCCRLAIASAGSFGVFFGLIAAGQRGGETFFSNPLLAITMLLAAALAVSGATAGVVAMIRQAERAWSVVLVIAFGLLVLAFATGEILLPH